MAGHSKWAQIKRKKAVTDSRRGQLWTKLLKEISVAARLGGSDPSGNARLRTAIFDARSNNVPNDNIHRAVKRGTGELEGVIYEEVVYEGYGPGGVAILIETMTDNRNRTVADIRHLFSKHGGNLGENGCVGWMFDKRGYFAFDPSSLPEESFMELAVELEAADISLETDVFEMYVESERYLEVKDDLGRREIATVATELAMVPQNYQAVEPDKAQTNLRLIEALEDHDDVQHAWANVELSAELLSAGS
ncbi:MAG: YebC/PmpR family DNA-binding transcriptional regulator [Acidobacteriota bacterium]|nr:YebC/PmpR family DNA-binding transcriptional regulator [Acidobacteriota bacterium]